MKPIIFTALVAALFCTCVQAAPATDPKAPTPTETTPDTGGLGEDVYHLEMPQTPPKTKIEAFLLQTGILVAHQAGPCWLVDAPKGQKWDLMLEPIVAYVPGRKELKAKGMMFIVTEDGEDATKADNVYNYYADEEEAVALSQALLTLANLKVVDPKAFEGSFATKSHVRIASTPGVHAGESDTTLSIEGHPNIFSWKSNSDILKLKKRLDDMLAWLQKQ